MISTIANITSLVVMLTTYILHKIYDTRHSYECRKCYSRKSELNKKGHCNVCSRDIKIDSITKRFKINIYINPHLLTAFYWIMVSLSIILTFISVIFHMPIYLTYGAISLIIASITYLYSVCKELKFKNNGDNS